MISVNGARGGAHDRVREIGEERHVGQERGHRIPCQGRGGDRESAALAPAGDGDARCVDAVQPRDLVDQPHRVGVEAAVVVVAGVEDAPGHHTREGGGRSVRIGGVADAPRRSLPAGVHDDVDVARTRPGGLLAGQAPAPAVTDELDDRRQVVVAVRAHDPAADLVAAEAREGQVLHAQGPHRRGDIREPEGAGRRPCLGERLVPERVQIVGRGERRTVLPQELEGKVGESLGHADLRRCGGCTDSSEQRGGARASATPSAERIG